MLGPIAETHKDARPKAFVASAGTFYVAAWPASAAGGSAESESDSRTGDWKAPAETTKASGPSGPRFVPAKEAGGLWANGSCVA